jgi:hypothetical protein
MIWSMQSSFQAAILRRPRRLARPRRSVMVNQILVAECDPDDALHQHGLERMLDKGRIAMVLTPSYSPSMRA